MSRIFPHDPRAGCHDPAHGLFWYLILVDCFPVGTVWIERLNSSSPGILGIFLGNPSFFGRGIGRSAISLAVTAFRRACPGVPISLNVRQANLRAISCYRRAGFAIVGNGTKTSKSGTEIPFLRMTFDQAPQG
jgi:RimJ/RimL family protein N-acetyltransferase